jgi:hypothetical protein
MVWAFDTPQKVGSTVRRVRYRWGEGELVDPTVPMAILREATREEWERDGGALCYDDRHTLLWFYDVSVD